MSRFEKAVLNCISDENRDKLISIGEVVRIPKGKVIYGEKEETEDVYFVLKGYVALFRNSRYGEVKIIFICSENEMLNELSIEKPKTSVAAKTLSNVLLLKVKREELISLLKNDFELVKAIFDSMSAKTRRLYHQVGNANNTYPLEKRLASKIYRLSKNHGIESEDGIKIGFEITVTFLASMLGAKRETVSRIISSLKKAGIIRHENGVLTVLKPDELHALL